MGIRTYALSGLVLLSMGISPEAQAKLAERVPAPTGPISVIPLANAKVRPLVPATLGILVNTNDPDSMKLALAYAAKRGIPAANIVSIRLPVKDRLSKAEFQPVVSQLTSAQSSKKLVAWAIAWNKPWAVENQSITSAVTEGIANLNWAGQVCITTNGNAAWPLQAGAALPKPISMMLAGGTTTASMDLINRAGVGDAQNVIGDSYLMDTTDSVRTGARKYQFADAVKIGTAKGNSVQIVKSNALMNKTNVLSYQTGMVSVSGLDTLKFQGGAYADHLTSTGGVLNGSTQMPITKFIQAGATASFGTVREPCAYAGKFPNVSRQIDRYLSGDSLIEAYWKSVEMATEGVFIGEPLARPFNLLTVNRLGAIYVMRTNRLTPTGTYNLAEVSSGTPRIVQTNMKLAPSSEGVVVSRLGMSLPAGVTPVFALIKVQ